MTSQTDYDARTAALNERVEGQGRRLSSLEQTVTTGFRQIEGSISALSTEFRNNQRPQWQALSVLLVAVSLIGALAYWPIREQQSDIKADVANIVAGMATGFDRAGDRVDKLAEQSLSVQSFLDFKGTYENNRVVSRTEYLDKFSTITTSIDKVKDDMVPRKEHERVWASLDLQSANERESRIASDQNLQRQLDEVKQYQSGMFNQRDLNMQVLERLDRVERDKNRALGIPQN